ncbi:carnosine synthase 1-like [Argopecten irradians]|uniref:carnosine synthase 1-like n=1 Tax=Argopecten irradians TaxID=31199 RepID=UPI003719E148
MSIQVYPEQMRQALEGKTILVIGTSNSGNRLIWDIFTEVKLKVILVAHTVYSDEPNKVHSLICYDYSNQSDIDSHANNIIQLLGDRHIDGCFTFTEADTPITAVICQKLGVRGIHPDAAMTVRSKHNTYQILRQNTTDCLYTTEIYSPISYRIGTVRDISDAKKITYPAVLKPEFDVGSWGVVKVTSKDDCLSQINRLQRNFDTSRLGGKFGKSLVLMELLQGLSYNVDVVIYDGELMIGLITDVGLYLPNMFVDTATCQPSSLSDELQTELTTAAHQCCCKVGLVNGVFNTEWKITESGPKLVEINGRIGMYRRSIVYKTTHGVILWEIAAAIACGIKPSFPDISVRSFAVGAYLYTKFHREQFLKKEVIQTLKSLANAKAILLEMFELKDLKQNEEEFPLSFCHLVALSNKDIKHARQALLDLYRSLGFTETEYDIEKFTSLWA